MISLAAPHDGKALEIRLLGGLEVIRDGTRLPLPASRKTRGLLAYLSLATRPCRRDDLCDLLWEDVADPRAELRWSLSKLRVLLGPLLIASPDGVVIAGETLTVDAAVFRRLVTSSSSPHDSTRALALWRGDPLADADVPGLHRFHVWWTAEREALVTLHRRMLHERIDALWPCPHDGLGMARSLVARYPLDEWGHARVAQALNQDGRPSEARTYLEATRQALSLELGLPPASVMVDIPDEPDDKPTPSARRKNAARLKIGVLPLQVPFQDDALQATATHVASVLAHGLWQSGLCDVAELDWRPPETDASLRDLTYAVRGSLARLDGGIRLSLRCIDAHRGTVLWSAHFGPARFPGAPVAGWVERAVGAIQSLVQTTETRRALQHRGGQGQDLDGLLLEAQSLASALEPVANQAALALLDTVLNEAPDDPRALALQAWCHAQRCIYNWSVNPDDDRGDVERYIAAATRLGADDPICLTVLGAARSQVADQTSANALLGRALQLNPYSSLVHARIGYVAIYLDQADRAARHFRASMALAPNDPAMFNSMTGLGMAYFIKSNPNRAIEWMEKGLALHPRAVWINRNLAPAYIAAERQVDAERCVSALLHEYSGLSVAAVGDAMVMSRPTMARIIDGLSRAGLPRS
jgi:DNA-binding SARP family transcriptional activator/tetratricopeptide (TPR) repeat protein